MKPWSRTEARKIAFVDLSVSENTDIFLAKKGINHVGFSEMRTRAASMYKLLVSWKRVHPVVNTRRSSG